MKPVTNMIPFLEVVLPRKVKWFRAFIVNMIKEIIFSSRFLFLLPL